MQSWALLRAVAAHLFFAATTVCAQTDKYIPPEQTAWQLELFKNVSAEAAARSAEARPELLAELDKKSFREELAQCCPSFVGLSASELLDHLVEDTAFVEVTSGFESIPSPTNDLGTGMTVDDGLNGSYFQNMWERRLLHNETFVRSNTVYGFANKTDAEGDEMHLTLWIWGSTLSAAKGCRGDVPRQKIATVVGKCIEIPQAGKIVGVHRENSSANLSVAIYASSSEHLMSSLGPRHMSLLEGLSQAYSSSESEVPCPHKDPDTAFTLPLNEECNAIEYLDDWWFRFEDAAEMSLYGLKPFTSPGKPKGLGEASERGSYSLANIYRLDSGSPLFGDVSAVFSSKLMLKSALVSGVDTGFISWFCQPHSDGMRLRHNCSAYHRFMGLGTMEHINHVLLQNHEFWQQLDAPGGLLRHLARMEGPWGAKNITDLDLLTYFEVAPAANPLYPSGIRFLIATFNSLFGTAVGDKLRTWASRRGWVLLWSLGLNSDTPVTFSSIMASYHNGTVDMKLNQRIIDPSVANKTTAKKGLPLDAGTCEMFEKHWVAARRLRALRPSAGNETWLAKWKHLRHQIPEELQVTPTRARASCPKPGPGVPECVGITASGKCVCYELTEQEQRQAQKQEEEVEAEERLAEPLIVA